MKKTVFLALVFALSIPPVHAGTPVLRAVACAEDTVEIGRASRGVWMVMPNKGPDVWRWEKAKPTRVPLKPPRWLESIDRVEDRGNGTVVFGRDRKGNDFIGTLQGGKVRKLKPPFDRAQSIWMAGKKPFAAVIKAQRGNVLNVWGPKGKLDLPKQKEVVPGINPSIGDMCQQMIPTCDFADVTGKRLAVCLSGCSRLEPALLAIWEGKLEKAVYITLGKELHPDAVVLQGDHALVLTKHDDLRTYSDFFLFDIDLAIKKTTRGPKLPSPALEVHKAGIAHDGSLWTLAVIKQGERLPNTLWRYAKKWEQIPLQAPGGEALELSNFVVDGQGEIWASATQPGESNLYWVLTTARPPASGVSLPGGEK
ncbi:hypothetical protein ACFL2F_02035 [Myxococcota bacterium]